MKKIGITVLILVLFMVTWQNMELKKFIRNDILQIEQPIETNSEENTRTSTPLVVSSQPTPTFFVDVDEEIISYVDTLDKEVNLLTNTQDLTTEVKSKLKNAFITLTDFLFYNGTIKGITFHELSTSAKEKVLEIYASIDQKIESVWPNYKDTIQTTSKNIYTNVKDKVMQLKEELQQKYRDSIGEEAYYNSTQIFEEDIERLEESTAPVTNYIKESYESLKEKANNWYQNIKESSE